MYTLISGAREGHSSSIMVKVDVLDAVGFSELMVESPIGQFNTI